MITKILTVFVIAVFAPILLADYTENELAREMINELVEDYGFSEQTLTDVIAKIVHQPKIIETIQRPAESISWFKYQNIFITEQRINNGVKFANTHAALLDQAYKEYGVPPEIITAVIGVETNYGKNMGTYRVLDSLATLGFDYPPRADFFRSQLKEFLILACEERIAPFDADDACDREAEGNASGQDREIFELVGSYAGAMGFGQFIPSSYRHFAIDYDGDGMRDIWTNIHDAVGSVANYFVEHNWKEGQPVAEFVNVDTKNQMILELINPSTRPTKTITEWKSLGIPVQSMETGKANLYSFAIDAKEPPTHEYMIGFHNFYVITRYNHSRLYGRVVNDLANAIKAKLD